MMKMMNWIKRLLRMRFAKREPMGLLCLVLFLGLGACCLQAQVIVGASFEETYGKGIRKVVQRERCDEPRRTVYRFDLEGQMVSSPYQVHRRRRVETFRDETTGEEVVRFREKRRMRYIAGRGYKKDRHWAKIEIRTRRDTLAGQWTRRVDRRYEYDTLTMVHVEKRDLRTLTDSLFETLRDCRGTKPDSLGLTSVVHYADAGFRTRTRYEFCEKHVLNYVTTFDSVGDTLVCTQVGDTNAYVPKPFFEVTKRYAGGEATWRYAPDSSLLETRRVVFTPRGLIDTIYEWKSARASRGTTRNGEAYERVETHVYSYNSRGGVTEERIYVDGQLVLWYSYRLKYWKDKKSARR